MYTVESLRKEIFSFPKPKHWRDGQFVFNYIDQIYGIARLIQFKRNVDCFYRDEHIDKFLKEAVEILNKE